MKKVGIVLGIIIVMSFSQACDAYTWYVTNLLGRDANVTIRLGCVGILRKKFLKVQKSSQ